MSEPDKIYLRRQLLEWRDKHLINIHRHLNHEMNMLLLDIDKKLEETPLTELFKTNSYYKTHIEPIYREWVENESIFLLQSAQNDLNKIYQHLIEIESKPSNLGHKNNFNGGKIDAAKAVAPIALAVAATPTIMSLSLGTASASGIIGILGITTTVINWPIALAGGSIILGLSNLGFSKLSNLKSNTIKKQLHKFIQDQTVGLNNENSICNSLQSKIEDVTKTLIRDLDK